MAQSTYHTRRTRYRGARRRSKKLEAFLQEMATKYSLQGTPLTLSAVGNPSNTIDLPSTPTAQGPFTLYGALPPELRNYDAQLGNSVKCFWLRIGASDISTIHQSAKDAAATPVNNFRDANVTAGTDAIVVPGHGMTTGQGPITMTSTGTLPAGLNLATNYWVIVVDADTIKVASTLANALANTPVDITAAAGGGVHTLVRAGIRQIQLALWNLAPTFAAAAVNTGTDAINLTGHGMQSGDGPVQFTTSGGLPAGIVALTDYWVIRVDADNFKIAASRANALAGTPVIDITTQGTGTHTLNRAIKLYRCLGSKDGIMRWLAQGVKPSTMKLGTVGNADTIFK